MGYNYNTFAEDRSRNANQRTGRMNPPRSLSSVCLKRVSDGDGYFSFGCSAGEMPLWIEESGHESMRDGTA
jgi:hypothetical protein